MTAKALRRCHSCEKPAVRHSNRGYCKSCKALYDKVRKAEIKQKYKEFLNKLGCASCEEKHPDCLEVHHLYKGAKRFKSSRGQSNSYNVLDINEGVAIVLCANCHLHFHSYFGGRHADFPSQTKESTIECINLNKSRRIVE